MYVTNILRRLLKPHGVILLTFGLSFLAWLIPDFGYLRKGFDPAFSLWSLGFLVVLLWYTTAFFAAYLGFHLGTSFKARQTSANYYLSFTSNFPYQLLSLLALVGVTATLIKIVGGMGGFQNVIQTILSGQANQLKYTLYQDYSLGLVSLRYVSIHAMALALFRRFTIKQRSKLDFINILCLLVTALISSRLALVMSLFEFFVLVLWHSRVKLTLLKPLFIFLMTFLILSIFSYSRNKGYYESRDLHFWSAGVSEIITYLGAPFQGAMAVGNNPAQIVKEPLAWDQYAHIEKVLSTNSSLLSMFIKYRWWSFLVMPLGIFGFAVFSGFLYKQKENHLFLIYLTLLYGFAEFWRLYWFGSGIMLTLVGSPIFIFLITIFLKKKYAKKEGAR